MAATDTVIITTMPERSVFESAAGVSSADVARLLAWLSPAFPVGAYTYSHGLEWAIEDGTVTAAESLEAWLADVLVHGAGRNDAILMVHAHRAATAGDVDNLRAIAALAAAFQPSKERHLEATAQGNAFLRAVIDAWPNEPLVTLAKALEAEPAVCYPVAVATAAAAHGLPVEITTVTALNAFVANIISAGVRAIPVGQSDGQRLIAHFAPRCQDVAARAMTASLDDLGGIALRADIASMKHETQYTRLFRS